MSKPIALYCTIYVLLVSTHYLTHLNRLDSVYLSLQHRLAA